MKHTPKRGRPVSSGGASRYVKVPGLAVARLDRSMSRRDLAEKIGASASSIRDWEIGARKVHVDTVAALAKALRVSQERIKS